MSFLPSLLLAETQGPGRILCALLSRPPVRCYVVCRQEVLYFALRMALRQHMSEFALLPECPERSACKSASDDFEFTLDEIERQPSLYNSIRTFSDGTQTRGEEAVVAVARAGSETLRSFLGCGIAHGLAVSPTSPPIPPPQAKPIPPAPPWPPLPDVPAQARGAARRRKTAE